MNSRHVASEPYPLRSNAGQRLTPLLPIAQQRRFLLVASAQCVDCHIGVECRTAALCCRAVLCCRTGVGCHIGAESAPCVDCHTELRCHIAVDCRIGSDHMFRWYAVDRSHQCPRLNVPARHLHFVVVRPLLLEHFDLQWNTAAECRSWQCWVTPLDYVSRAGPLTENRSVTQNAIQ